MSKTVHLKTLFKIILALFFPPSVMEALFLEELGLVLEVCENDVESVRQRYTHAGLCCYKIGTTCGFGPDAMVSCSISELLCTNVCLPFPFY